MKPETAIELGRRVEEGNRAKEFLASDAWNLLVKPMLDSMVKGLTDVRSLTINSSTDAAVEVKSRVLAANYIEGINNLLESYVVDGQMAEKAMTTPADRNPLTQQYGDGL